MRAWLATRVRRRDMSVRPFEPLHAQIKRIPRVSLLDPSVDRKIEKVYKELRPDLPDYRIADDTDKPNVR